MIKTSMFRSQTTSFPSALA